MKTTQLVACLGVAATALLSACSSVPPISQSSKQTPAGPPVLLADAYQAQAAPTVAALATSCGRLATDLAATPVPATTSSVQWQQVIVDLSQAQSQCMAVVNTTPASARGGTPTSGIDLSKSMVDDLTSAIQLMKAIDDAAAVPSPSTPPSPATPPSIQPVSTPTGATPSLPYTITVHIDDQPLATPDGRTLSPPAGTVGMSYQTETYQCADGMVCGANVFHYSGGMVTLTAGWDNTSKFLGWDGAPCTTANVCRFTLTSNLDVTAHFAPATYTLTIDNFYPDGGEVLVSPGGIWCGDGGTDCSALERSNTPLAVLVSGAMTQTTDYDVILVKGPGCDLNLQAAPPTTEATCMLNRSQDTTIQVNFSPEGLPNPYPN